jgi:hypothetical protein
VVQFTLPGLINKKKVKRKMLKAEECTNMKNNEKEESPEEQMR